MNKSKNDGTNCVGEPRNKYGFCVGVGGQGSSKEPILEADDLLRRIAAAGITTAYIGGD